jgi:outer membrane protein, heavy metal efflux system
MMLRYVTRYFRYSITYGTICLLGCAHRSASIPPGYFPPSNTPNDSRVNEVLNTSSPKRSSFATDTSDPKKGKPFQLPSELPGSNTPPIVPPRFTPDTPAAERQKRLREIYPQLIPVRSEEVQDSYQGKALSLADLQTIALESSPAIRKSRAEADSAMGAMIQAGLYPNPTIGYQGDQIQPSSNALNNPAQHGAFLNQILKFPGKLPLAQAVAGYDYLNATIAVRRAQIDLATQVRQLYFAILVGQKSVEINTALAELADEVYQLQLSQLAAGEAAGYEPLQLYAQAVQARNLKIQSENTVRASWKRLAAALNQPDLPQPPFTGTADTISPMIDPERMKAQLLEANTDLLSARNNILQAHTNYRLQKLTPVPDLLTNTVVQRDNTNSTSQVNVQLGIQLPLFDRNQGNIASAMAQIVKTNEALQQTQNSLLGQFAEATNRYQANARVVANYRDRILPNLTRAYQGMIRRYQTEPEKVGFNDIVVAQQNLAQALQNYLSALEAQWQAFVDVGNLTQQDDLFENWDMGKPIQK